MSEQKLGTEKLEALLTDLKELVVVAKKIEADGKVDATDLATVITLLPKLPGMISDIKAVAEAVAEAKDLEVSEIVTLVQKIASLVKEVEQA